MRHRAAALLLLLLTACAPVRPAATPPPGAPASAAQPTPPGAPAPDSAPPPAGDAVVSDQPLWGPPGTTVWARSPGDGPEQILARSYAPFTLQGRTFYPVQAGDLTYLLRQADGAVYLDGYLPWEGYIVLLPTPRLLWRLPLRTGASFGLEREAGCCPPHPVTYRVTGTASLPTPGGRLPAVVLTGEGGDELWWSPGVGLVRDQLGRTATRVEHGPALPVPALARLDDGTTALAVAGYALVDQDGRPLLDAAPGRGGLLWADAGAPSPLFFRWVHSQAEPHRVWQGFAYDPEQRRFVPVGWRLPDGRVKAQVAGDLAPAAGTPAVSLRDDERYPYGTCTFRWAGDALACARYGGESLAGSEQAFARLVTLPLDEESWARLFVDPAAGRAAYRQTRSPDGRNRLMLATPQQQPDGSWRVDGPQGSARFTLVRQGDDWRIARWQMQP